MKNFKNKLYISGPPSLKEAMAKELVNLGMVMTDEVDYKRHFLFNLNYRISSCDFYANSKNSIELKLPEDWNKCLELAS
jgi:hypothetical protein